LKEATPEFIKKYKRPPQSPDCNHVDYAIYGTFTPFPCPFSMLVIAVFIYYTSVPL